MWHLTTLQVLIVVKSLLLFQSDISNHLLRLCRQLHDRVIHCRDRLPVLRIHAHTTIQCLYTSSGLLPSNHRLIKPFRSNLSLDFSGPLLVTNLAQVTLPQHVRDTRHLPASVRLRYTVAYFVPLRKRN